MSRPSSFKFDTHLGTKQRIAHKTTTSSSLLNDLEHKKQSITQVLSNKLSPKKLQKSNFASLGFGKPKRRKLSKMDMDSDDCEFIDDEEEIKNTSSTSNDDDDLAVSGTISPWLSKRKPDPRIQQPKKAKISKSGIISKPPNQQTTKFPSRIVLSSDENDEDFKPVPDAEQNTLSRKTIVLSDDDLDLNDIEYLGNGNSQKKPKDELEEKLDEWLCSTSSLATTSPQKFEKKKKEKPKRGTLKSLKKKTVKLMKKNKKTNNNAEDGSDYSQADSDMDGEIQEGSYDSDDSNAGEYISSKRLKKVREIQQKCLEFLNTATSEELHKNEKLTDKFLEFILNNRPFNTFEALKEKASKDKKVSNTIGKEATSIRLLATLDNLLEWMENRGVLDQVLEDCRRYSKAIEKATEEAKQQKPGEKPTSLNPNYSLHPYQEVGLNWLIMMHNLGMNSILADEMGLGKTIQVIAFFAWAKEQGINGPHLIVVPASTIENWMQEIARWAPDLRVLAYYGSMEERLLLRHSARKYQVDLILTTYTMVISKAEDRKFFKKFSLNYVCYDEGHLLKNCSTQRYTNLMRIRGKRKILLTGTPLQNNLVELFSLLYFTMSKLFDKYCDDMNSLFRLFKTNKRMLNKKRITKKKANELTEEGMEIDEQEKEESMEQHGQVESLYEQHKINQAKTILQPFVLRRLKTEVLSCLPKKHERIEICKPTKEQADIYAGFVEELRQQKTNNTSLGAGFLNLLLQMRQVANHPLLYRRHYDDVKVMKMAEELCRKEKTYERKRADYLAEDLAFQSDIALHLLCQKFDETLGAFLLDESLALESGKFHMLDKLLPKIITEKGEKVLIFSQFLSVLDVLEIYMKFHNYHFLRLDGSTPVLERQELIDLFNKDPTISVFLLSTKAGGLGINLTAANHIIIHDIDLNPYNDRQAEDRCHRMGQTREVFVTRLICKDSIEEQMLTLAKQKLELERDVTNSNSLNTNGIMKDNPQNKNKMMHDLLTQTLRHIDEH